MFAFPDLAGIYITYEDGIARTYNTCSHSQEDGDLTLRCMTKGGQCLAATYLLSPYMLCDEYYIGAVLNSYDDQYYFTQLIFLTAIQYSAQQLFSCLSVRADRVHGLGITSENVRNGDMQKRQQSRVPDGHLVLPHQIKSSRCLKTKLLEYRSHQLSNL